MKLHHIGLSVLSLGMVAALAGCGGGSSGVLGPNNPTNPPTADSQRFNGQYTGNLAGASTDEGIPVTGNFTNTISGNGQIVGATQVEGRPDPPTTNTMGNIDSNGNITITSSNLTLNGTTALANGSATSSGTLTIRQNNRDVVKGIFASARAEATANPFAGVYNGSFGNNSNVTFTLTADNNGAVSGTITQPFGGTVAAVGDIPAVGTIDRAGDLSVRAISTLTGQPSIVLLTTLTGKVFTDNGTVQTTGRFGTTINGQQNAGGDFNAIRQ